MSALERNVPLREIVISATAAAESGELATCPYPRASAAAWCWIHVFSEVLATSTIEIMEAA
jgi:hypothetical protein